MKPNWRLLEEASMENISTLILRRQLSMFGHVARLPASDPVHRIISCPDPPEWKRRRGRPPLSWLKRIEGVFRGEEGSSAAWELAKGLPDDFTGCWGETQRIDLCDCMSVLSK